MDHVFIRGLEFETLIGFHRRERHMPQRVRVDLEIGIADPAVFASDRVADCIDYDKVVRRVQALARAGHVNLVETLAERIAAMVLAEFGAAEVRVAVCKPGVLADAREVGVSITRRP